MEFSFADFIRAKNERNQIQELALQHAISILKDLQCLNKRSQRLMVENLIELISLDGDEYREVYDNRASGSESQCRKQINDKCYR